MTELFKYKALSEEGQSLKGEIAADSQVQVLEFLAERRLLPVRITSHRRKKPFSFSGFFKGTDYENLIMFTNSLATLYRAGVPLLRALAIMKIGPEGGRFNSAIEQIRFSLQSGKQLSQAMEDYDDLFSQTYRASIAAGEESGKLDEILGELSAMLEKELELNRQIKSGIRYPLMVISAIVAAFITLITFVIPRFVAFYGNFGAELPLPTQLLIAVSSFFSQFWWLLLLTIAALLYGFRRMVGYPAGKLWIDRRLLKLPVFGDIITKGNVARFSLMFRILYQAGIPIIKSLSILSESVRNSMIAAEITKLGEVFSLGKESSLPSAGLVFLPNLALEMMAIGLESGSLEKMLGVLGEHYSREVQYRSRQLASVLEPLLTLILAVFVLLMALAIMLPMWNLIKVFNPS
ncbi:MAG: type II secretion system F family protein [candidate division Zixibacteria bacterium]|nr:type II secretion system F family protein [candidate division Zixibacteria bacterium]